MEEIGNLRIKLPHQCASRLIIMLERSMNKRTCVSMIHVIESASTPVAVTATAALWLQFWMEKRLCQALGIGKRRCNERTQKNCNRPGCLSVITCRSESIFAKQNQTNYEKKHINAGSRGCDCAWRLCRCAGTSWPWWARGLAWARIRPAASNRAVGSDF